MTLPAKILSTGEFPKLSTLNFGLALPAAEIQW